jgi:hypothetical protein
MAIIMDINKQLDKLVKVANANTVKIQSARSTESNKPKTKGSE